MSRKAKKDGSMTVGDYLSYPTHDDAVLSAASREWGELSEHGKLVQYALGQELGLGLDSEEELDESTLDHLLGCKPDPPDPQGVLLGKDLDEIVSVYAHFSELLNIVGASYNKAHLATFKMMCDDCEEGPCDVTTGVSTDASCHKGENFREDGFYVGNFR